MIKKLISLLIALALLGLGIYIHLIPLTITNLIIAFVALMLSLLFRGHGYKGIFTINGLIFFAYLLRYLWDWISTLI